MSFSFTHSTLGMFCSDTDLLSIVEKTSFLRGVIDTRENVSRETFNISLDLSSLRSYLGIPPGTRPAFSISNEALSEAEPLTQALL